MFANFKNGTLLLMINQSTELQAHVVRRLIVMLFKLPKPQSTVYYAD